jgi:hypothetical protein
LADWKATMIPTLKQDELLKPLATVPTVAAAQALKEAT